ncbi:3-deoxy-7-phosphoheptulonate synthase [Nonomuraea basaltis]|uniref:3-deoxy-7-phosphoheptulonate synthase n=1 Tax=Nonomuraea basaltis TaxID=2495887 RepID=UPI00110C66C2|nr:3-deoxy-7-phosphoheptulonate synthase [Nonomuraea basaltis]TMR99140.1 3-deoxy-7-phosphoheptulonate synthase [Nonomuraea basaltis]
MLLSRSVAASAVPLPDWSAGGDLAAVVAELGRRPALVSFEPTRALRERLAEVATAGGFVLHAGDCAEMFAEVSPGLVARKVAQLTELAAILADVRDPVGTVVVGRIAGQFAKPRSYPTEAVADGSHVPIYMGDAVNGLAATPLARTPQAGRLLLAYDKSAEVLGHLAAARTPHPVFTSHEALLHPYEEPLVRPAGIAGAVYASSAHLLWVGDRTRQADGPHVALAARVANPVAVKLGPSARPEDVAALVEALDPGREPGRLTFVARLGTGRVAESLPGLLAAARDSGARPLWLCDPMHGNTGRHDGYKIRVVDHVIAEARSFVRVARYHGVRPAGLHLEITPDDVVECLDHAERPLPSIDPTRYRTGCDPRLNPEQARRVVTAFAEELAR